MVDWIFKEEWFEDMQKSTGNLMILHISNLGAIDNRNYTYFPSTECLNRDMTPPNGVHLS